MKSHRGTAAIAQCVIAAALVALTGCASDSDGFQGKAMGAVSDTTQKAVDATKQGAAVAGDALSSGADSVKSGASKVGDVIPHTP